MISIDMLRLCNISICKPLEKFFQNCSRSGKFLRMEEEKCSSQIEKGNKKPIKIIVQFLFSRFVAKHVFIFFFSEKNLISPKQSRFRKGDSCSSQLLSVAHKILYHFMMVTSAVRGIFLNTFKILSSYNKTG